jgi:anthranilate/para-aminobenzoate synthase component I
MQTAPFVELLAVPQAQAKNPLFDIIVEGNITIQSYCNALIDKILKLNQSQFPAFIDYQFNLVKNPEVWICKLEKLLANNEAFFSSKTAMSRYNKLYFLIEKKRAELQSSCVKSKIKRTPKRLINANSDDRHFSFYEVKNHVETLDNFTEKIIYLTEEVFAYRQADKFSINTTLQVYDEQCSQLIEQLQTIRKMKAELEKEKKEQSVIQTPNNKMQFNGNVNQLVDVFYQLHRELFVDGKPYIDGNTNDLIALITNSFLDKEGKEISPQTVKTILKPSKEEKRPNNHKRLDIDKLL